MPVRTRTVWAVVRNCCHDVGGGCGRCNIFRGGRPGPSKPRTGCVKVIQWITFDEAKARDVASKWTSYKAEARKVTEDLLKSVEQDCLGWVREKLARPDLIHGYKKE